MATQENKMGRPSIYTEELRDKICEGVALGKSLTRVLEEENMPVISTVFKWLTEKKDFSDKYAQAKEIAMEAMAEDILDLSDGAIGVIKSGAEKKSGALAQAVKLQVDTRKWLMSKLKAKKYGDKVDVTSNGKTIEANKIVFENFSGAKTKGK